MTDKSALNIDRIILHNYRTYLGTHKLTISQDADKPITVIHGPSGLGKTTILNAIMWALYGSERVQLDTEHTGEGRMNKHALERLPLNDDIETYVELWLNDDEGLLYRIKRSIKAFKSTDLLEQRFNSVNGSLVREGIHFQPPILSVHYRSGTDPQPIKMDNQDHAQQTIENIFPKALSSYILFDAELLSHFLTQKEEELVKNGIEEISGLPLLDTTVSNLKKAQRKITQELKDQLPYRGLISQSEELEQRYNDCQEKHATLAELLKKLVKEAANYQDYLINHSVASINEKAKRLQEIEKEEKTLTKTINETNERFRTFLCENIYKLHLRPTIVFTEDKFRQWEQDGRIPPAINKSALDQMTNSQPAVCICGRSLEEGSDELLRLQKMKDRIVDSAITQDIMHGRARLSIMLENATKSKISSQYYSYSKDLALNRNKLMSLTASRKTIKKELQDHSFDEARDVLTKQEQNKNEQARLFIEIGELNNEIKSIAKLHDANQTKIKNAETAEGKNKAIHQKIALCEIAASRLRQIRIALLDEFKTRTEEITSEYFLKIAPRKEDFSAVKILSGFQLRALDKHGVSKNLSMGQSHCLGLAYISAIREITKHNYFIMIDSPLHNISQEAKVELAERFPHYLKKTQLTLLVTDQEYTGIARSDITGPLSRSVRDVLFANNSVWKEYKLAIKKDKNNNTHTEILEGVN